MREVLIELGRDIARVWWGWRGCCTACGSKKTYETRYVACKAETWLMIDVTRTEIFCSDCGTRR